MIPVIQNLNVMIRKKVKKQGKRKFKENFFLLKVTMQIIIHVIVRQSAIPQGGPPDRKADINPITLDTNIRFNDVGGLESHIHCLKEMVVFPMMYPDIFERFHVTPPKGVLFHGPPGILYIFITLYINYIYFIK